MISSFWNLCRACPSVPVEKLHSEYRSTFQWHEYVGSRSDTSISHPTVVKQPSQAPQPHVFWSGGKDSGGITDQERRGKRHDFSGDRASNGWWLRSAEQVRSQSQRRTYHKQETLSGDGEGAGGPRKSLSMGTIRAFETSVPVHKQKLHDISNNAAGGGGGGGGVKTAEETQNIVINTNKGPSETVEWSDHRDLPEKMSSSFEADKPSDFGRKEYKSEYKKQFRPFSQYEYVDGRFLKKKGDQESGTGSPWYKEVIELRKKAGEYRYRGWGTELVPQHLAEVYHQSLWDQVSRRSSLAALALITTTTQRSISKEQKDKENARKSQPKRSLSRPNTATPKHPISDLEKSKSRDLETVHGSKKKPYEGAVSTVAGRVARGKARSQSAGPGGRSPRKGTRQSLLSKDRGEIEAHKPTQRHPRPSSADPSLGFSEPVIKSPPEPTRVKSPEQVILRSPDPVNWTVPLDTTKSFTVTQNIRDAPPSPRFRAGDRLHGVDSRSGHHQFSGQQSSAGSTKASSPLSSFSTRSAVAHTHSVGHPVTKSALLQDAHKVSMKGKEKENQVAGMVKAPASSGGGGGSGGGGPLKTSGENKILGSSHSTVNGFDEKKKSQVMNKPVTEKSKVAAAEISRVKEKKTSVPTTTAPKPPPSKTETTKPSPHEHITAPASRPSEASVSKPVPGTTLRCLEDPSFVFDPVAKDVEKLPNVPQKTTTSTSSDSSVAKKTTGLPKPIAPGRGSIQVLEAPVAPMPSTSEKLGFVPPPPVTTSKRSGLAASQVSALPPSQPRLPTYRVLDAPDPVDLYGNPSSSAAGRTKATDVIEKARNRFDKFWGKSKDDEK